ncbi:MAG: porin family protein, partial [Xanthobacteraceae bacterium]
MKKLAFGVTVSASVFVAGPALAADLPAPAYKAPAVAPFANNWTGFYVGGNAGWVGSANRTGTNAGTDTGAGGLGSVLAGGGLPASFDVPSSGFLGGGQIGYNWQINTWVVGLEADADWV